MERIETGMDSLHLIIERGTVQSSQKFSIVLYFRE